MTVRELLERLQGVDPEAVVLLWATDPDDPNEVGHFPLRDVDTESGAALVQVSKTEKKKQWIVGRYDPEQAVPAVWLE